MRPDTEQDYSGHLVSDSYN